jgi:O-antigen/teichoic acid export membrane protein
VFLNVLNTELLGISAALTSIVLAASLAEGGMGAAIVYHLYRNLEEKNYQEVGKILAIFRRVYHLIALLLIIFSMGVIPFLPYILSGVVITYKIYIYYFLIVANTASSYLLSYKRCIFTADRRDYVCKVCDGCFNVTFSLLRMVSLLIFANFSIYLLLSVLQTVGANVIIQHLYNKQYPEIGEAKFDMQRFRRLLPDFKDLFMGQLAAYLFNSSDNIIISAFVNAVSVGLLAGYTMVTKSIKNLIFAIFGSFGSILGRLIASTSENEKKRQEAFEMYCYSIYFLTLIIIVPEFVLLQDFVENIWGADYVMGNMIVWLLIIEQYITLVQDPCGVYIVANGEFKKCKIADGVAAFTNIISSLILVHIWGIEGVLSGTIISRIFQWLIKAYYVNISSLKLDKAALSEYWGNNVYKVFVGVLAVILCSIIYSRIFINKFIIRFVVGGVMSVVVTALCIVAFSFFTEEFKLTIRYVINRERK